LWGEILALSTILSPTLPPRTRCEVTFEPSAPAPKTMVGSAAPSAGIADICCANAGVTLERLGLGPLQESYDKAVAGAEARHDRRGEEGWTSPMAVVRDGSLSLDAKRAILIDWTEYLIDQAISEGSPEIGRPSRLQEVELALRALERGNAPAGSHTPAPLLRVVAA
jgi:hypothetical protein